MGVRISNAAIVVDAIEMATAGQGLENDRTGDRNGQHDAKKITAIAGISDAN